MARLFRIVLLGWIACAAWSAAAAAPAKRQPDVDDRIQTVEGLVARIEQIRKETGTPAMGFALIEGGRTQWVGSLGQANVERQAKADANTIYRIGSVSKMFVALAVLKLVEEGRLHLDDKVHDLAPEIAFENQWEASDPVRLVHLLEHTTGWDDMHLAEYAYAAPAHLGLKEGLALHPDSRTSRWVPGTRMSYCNTGPVVAAYIIEKITGIPFEDYVQRNFLSPLGMDATSYFETDAYRQRGASLYVDGKAQPYWQFYGRPAGTMNASPADMAKLVHLLLGRGAYGGKTLLTPASIDRMEAQASSLGAASGITSGYGLHNYVSGYKGFGIPFHGHNGGLPGALTELSYSPRLGAGYVIMINTGGPALQKIADAARAYLVRNAPKPAIRKTPLPARFQALDGYFRPLNPRNGQFRIIDDVAGIMKISAQGDVLRREPLLGGWDAPSADYAVGANLLVNPWSGLPSIAFVHDPLEGQALAVDTNVYKPVSPIRVFGQFGLLALVAVASCVSILFAFVWIPRRLRGSLAGGSTVRVRAWPLLATLTLAAMIGLVTLVGADFLHAGQVNAPAAGLFAASLAYPLVALGAIGAIWAARRDRINRWVFWSSAVVAAAHALFCLFLASYGMIGVRLWA